MFHPYSHGKALGFQAPAFGIEQLVNITGGMTGSQDDRLRPEGLARRGRDGKNAVGRTGNIGYAGIEMIRAAMGFDAAADVFHNPGEFIRSHMGMAVDQDLRIGTEGHQLIKDFAHIAPLGRTGIELAVRESTGSPLSITIIGIGIHLAFAGKLGHIALAGMDILAPLQNYRTFAQRQKLQRREQAGGTRTNDDDRFGFLHVAVFRERIGLPVFFGEEGLDFIAVHHISPGIDRPMGNHAGCRRTGIGRLERFGGIHHVDNGIRTQAQFAGGHFADIVFAQFAADAAGEFKLSHNQ